MKIIVIGQSGQLAWELARLSDENIEIICFGREQIDITDIGSIKSKLQASGADAVINASAYTAVDLAETERDNAYLINATAVGNLATVCAQLSLHFVHVSTDFVFGGTKGVPYLPNEPYEPLGVYGESKAAGEQLIRQIIPEQSCIIRTSWVYSSHGNNFVKTMLRLMAEKPELGIISDQIGSPTYAKGLARVCLLAAVNQVVGIHHWSDAGVASWYDFAVAIQEIALAKHMLAKAIPIKPIMTKDYPTPAKRPNYSVLDKTSLIGALPELVQIHWRVQLTTMLDELQALS
ncbi:MAG: dTDP-4-dehydrorhamnose reductase [Methyloprofundus sp.]|nr:dTDP-4-dehydrorhamnose reductase [Methyloprofundus sp.]